MCIPVTMLYGKNRYPFLLPNLAVALMAFGSLPFVLFVLPETLSVKRVRAVAVESSDDIPRYEKMGNC